MSNQGPEPPTACCVPSLEPGPRTQCALRTSSGLGSLGTKDALLPPEGQTCRMSTGTGGLCPGPPRAADGAHGLPASLRKAACPQNRPKRPLVINNHCLDSRPMTTEDSGCAKQADAFTCDASLKGHRASQPRACGPALCNCPPPDCSELGGAGRPELWVSSLESHPSCGWAAMAENGLPWGLPWTTEARVTACTPGWAPDRCKLGPEHREGQMPACRPAVHIHVRLQTHRLTQSSIKPRLRTENVTCWEVEHVLLELELAADEGLGLQALHDVHLGRGALPWSRDRVRGAWWPGLRLLHLPDSTETRGQEQATGAGWAPEWHLHLRFHLCRGPQGCTELHKGSRTHLTGGGHPESQAISEQNFNIYSRAYVQGVAGGGARLSCVSSVPVSLGSRTVYFWASGGHRSPQTH